MASSENNTSMESEVCLDLELALGNLRRHSCPAPQDTSTGSEVFLDLELALGGLRRHSRPPPEDISTELDMFLHRELGLAGLQSHSTPQDTSMESEVFLDLELALGGLRCQSRPTLQKGYWADAEWSGESSAAAAHLLRGIPNAASLVPAPQPPPYHPNWQVQYAPVVAAVPSPSLQPQQMWGPPRAPPATVATLEDILAIERVGATPSYAVLQSVQPMFMYKLKWGRPEASNLPLMPCLAFTGEGPEGRRVLGYLRILSNNDLMIFCACHGAPFSPAGFLQHGGAVDLSDPLKRITLIRGN